MRSQPSAIYQTKMQLTISHVVGDFKNSRTKTEAGKDVRKFFDDVKAEKTVVQHSFGSKFQNFYYREVHLLPRRRQQVICCDGDYAQLQANFILCCSHFYMSTTNRVEHLHVSNNNNNNPSITSNGTQLYKSSLLLLLILIIINTLPKTTGPSFQVRQIHSIPSLRFPFRFRVIFIFLNTFK